MYSYNPDYEQYLAHYGVLGMKWGIRRYQPYTKGQKGIFKGLKKNYKKEKKVIKAERKYYQAQGDDLAVSNLNRELKNLKKSYNKTVDEVTRKFNKENWETYKEKVASTGSMEEVNRIKRELSGEQLWRATERFKAQNEFDRTRYGFDEKVARLNQIATTVDTAAKLGRSAINVADVARTIGNMNRSDLDYKLTSKDLSANKVAERVNLLKGQKDTTRLPTFSGARDTSTNYADKWNATQNRQKGNDKKKETSSNQNSGSAKTEKASKDSGFFKTETAKTENVTKNNNSSTFSTPSNSTSSYTKTENVTKNNNSSTFSTPSNSTSSYTKPKTYSEIREKIFGRTVSANSVNTSNPIIKAALNTKMDLGTTLNTTTKSVHTSDFWGGSDWNTTVSSKSLKMKVADLGYFTGKNDSSLVISGEPHKRLYNTYR